MKRLHQWMLPGLALSIVGAISGCGTTTVANGSSPSLLGSNSANQTVGASTSSTSPKPRGAVGWYYMNLSPFGTSAQIAGVSAAGGQLVMTAENTVTTALQTRQVYGSALVQKSSWTVGTVVHSTQPSGYRGSWSLKFGNVQYSKPIDVTLTDGSSSFTLPSSVPGYASQIMTDPAPFDNQIIGQSGKWVWLALKGPQQAPLPYMAYFRYWNRIVAVNTSTHAVRVFAIPPNTSQVVTGNNTPAFAQNGSYVYIGTGPWLGVFPAAPASTSVQVVIPEPTSIALQDQQDMLTGLQREVQAGANGLATFWNGYVMNGNQKDNRLSWEMQPGTWNHGVFPSSIDWAVRFPLKQGSSAYRTRARLLAQTKQLLNNPLDSAFIVYDTGTKLKKHYHGVPPAPIPGYVIKGGYYVKTTTAHG